MTCASGSLSIIGPLAESHRSCRSKSSPRRGAVDVDRDICGRELPELGVHGAVVLGGLLVSGRFGSLGLVPTVVGHVSLCALGGAAESPILNLQSLGLDARRRILSARLCGARDVVDDGVQDRAVGELARSAGEDRRGIVARRISVDVERVGRVEHVGAAVVASQQMAKTAAPDISRHWSARIGLVDMPATVWA